jgi:hypothetical protein
MKRIYKNRYGDEFTFTLQDDGNVLWEGNFEYCRFGMPNDYTEAYQSYLDDREGLDEDDILSLEEFKRDVHEYQDGAYLYPEYVRMVKSLTDEIDMVDPSGGCYLSRGMTLDFLGFVGVKVKDFKSVDTGFLIITEEPKQIKCYCRHTTSCDCSPLEEPNTINDWLEKHGNPEVTKQVEKEAKELHEQSTLKEAAETAWSSYEHVEGNLYSTSFKNGFLAGVKSNAARDYWFEIFKNKKL